MDVIFKLIEIFNFFLNKLKNHIVFFTMIFLVLLLMLLLLEEKYNIIYILKRNSRCIRNTIIVLMFSVLVIFDLIVVLDRKDLSLNDIAGVEFFKKQENLYDSSGLENFFYDYNGEIVESQNGSYMSNWIACSPGQHITRNGIATNVVCYFDEEKNFIKRIDSYGLETIVVPDDDRIKYVRMAVQPDYDRVIVYGDVISKQSINRDYYSISDLKISDRNLINDYTIVKSPNGRLWKIIVDDNGKISSKDVTSIISHVSLPIDFPEFVLSGAESKSEEDYYIAMMTGKEKGNYIFLMTNEGDIRWYKEVPKYAYNFRKIEYEDGTIIYAYSEYVGSKDMVKGATYFGKQVLMDESFTIINNNIHPLQYGSIKESDYISEVHDYKILSDEHYILSTVTFTKVNNIPLQDKECYVRNTIIQEQKDGKVIMQWESIDHPELYDASLYNNDFLNTSENNYTDYAHINSIFIDPLTKDLLISFRHIGLVKIDRYTGDVLWVMGRNKCDIKGISNDEIGYLQHDARYLEDGLITIFDNSGGTDNISRVCRYWIDEKNLMLEKCELYDTPYKSTSMGNATLLDDESDTYLICYGTGAEGMVFEERSFKDNKVNMRFKFNDGQVIYRIFTGTEKTIR